MPGFRFLDVPVDADGPALEGAMWYPCSEPPAEIDLGKITATFKITVRGAKNCPITGDKLPLVVFSHGKRSHLHEIDEALDVGRSPDHHLQIGGATDIQEVIAGIADSFAAVKVPVQLWASEHGGDGVSREGVAAVDRSLPARHEYHVVPVPGTSPS